MTDKPRTRPITPGETAPDFTVPAVSGEGDIGLGDYVGQRPLLVGLFRGIYCPFCRRHMTILDAIGRQLAETGVATMAVVTTPIERARRYFRYRPTKMVLGSNPDMSVHRAFGLPASEITKEPMEWPRTINLAEFEKFHVNPNDELEEAVSVEEAGKLLDAKDNFVFEPGDQEDANATWNQLCGIFLIDSNATVRWVHVEAADSPAGYAIFADKQEILDAAAAIADR